MKLKKSLNNEQGLADLLNYAHLVGEGVLVHKDGAFLVAYQWRGPDNHVASGEEMDALTAATNRMVGLLTDGWMVHCDVLRVPSVAYPEKGAFPDPVSALIDTERRQYYEAEGQHYENVHYLSFVWKWPLPVLRTARHWFIEGIERQEEDENLTALLKQFENTVERSVGLLSPYGKFEKLNSAQLLRYLNTCISGALNSVIVPPDGCFIDVVLGHHPVVGGYVPQVGSKYLSVLSLMGYLNEETRPGLLEAMGTYPLIYRWSNRFIPLSEETAGREIKRYERNWHNKVKGLMGLIKESVFGGSGGAINRDALRMHDQVQEALTANSNHSTRFGYWTSALVLFHEDLQVLQQAVKDLGRYLEQSGFTCHAEDIHALDAWLGTVPGHGSCNARRVFLHGVNLGHVLPLHSVWTGAAFSSPASLLPPDSPPVFYAATTGRTPFRFHLDVADVGHQVILGPTGAGKSTYLGFLIAQFLRYEHAQIFVFDKDYSHQSLTAALGGYHYDIGQDDRLSFCPLAALTSDSQKVRGAQFIEDCVTLQGVAITSDMRAAIHRAVEALSSETHTQNRNLTVLRSEVQHEAVRAALQYYTIDGQIKLLDATHDTLQTGYLQTFEMHWLLTQKPAVYLPVLRYIFDQIESRLEKVNAQWPTLIVLEEAWLYIAHDVFARQLKDWLKTLRKKNARVVFATQSLADLYDPSTKTLTDITAAIMESCPTKVYLPNPSMDAEIKGLYQKIGLSPQQLAMIAEYSVPKRDYYVVTPEGSRLMHLGLTKPHDLALSFIGLSKGKNQRLLACKAAYGEAWLPAWLRQEGQFTWAKRVEHWATGASGVSA